MIVLDIPQNNLDFCEISIPNVISSDGYHEYLSSQIIEVKEIFSYII